LELWDGQMGLFEDNPRREVAPNRRVVVFDLETQRSFDEVGGRSQLHRLGVSAGVAYRYERDDYLVVTEDTVGELVTCLTEADLVVGYNIRGFDYHVLRAYTDRDLDALPTLDLMQELESRLGFRPKLESVAVPTLGEGKSADGLQALEWWRRGELDKIIEYCREDVRVTRELYDFGKRNRCVLVARFGGKPRRVDVDW
jgi:DEAD/DEAH box helicase domain-containing protein